MTTYLRSECVAFRKTKETWGGLSNMAGGFPLLITGVRILTSEALYQACRFPSRPDVQRVIIAAKSPMSAKMAGKPYREETRPDWSHVRVDVMRWCLQVKLKQTGHRSSRCCARPESGILLRTRTRTRSGVPNHR